MPYIGGASSDNYIGNVPTTGGIGGAAAGADGADGAAGGSQNFTASGAIAAGDLVGLNDDGTVSKLGKYQEAQAYVATGDSTSDVVETVAVGSDGAGTYLFVYNDKLNNTGYLTARAGTYSSGSWTFGTAVSLESSANVIDFLAYPKVVWNSVKSVFVIFWKRSNIPKLIACSVSGTTITLGNLQSPNSTTAVFNTTDPSWGDIIVEPGTGTVFPFWGNASNAVLRYRGYTLGGTGNRTLTAGTITNVGGTSDSDFNCEHVSLSYDTAASKIVATYMYNSATYGLRAISGTISGTTITFGTSTVAPYDVSESHPTIIGNFKSFYNSTADRHVVFFDRVTVDSPVFAVQFELDGTSVTWSKAQGNSVAVAGEEDEKDICYDSDKDRYYVIGRRHVWNRDPIVYVTTVKLIDIDNVSASRGVAVENEIDMANGMDSDDARVRTVYDPTDKIVAMFSAKDQYNGSNVGKKGVVKALNVHAPYETFVGIATEAIADGATGTVTVTSGINENVTGLSAGQVYQISPKTGSLEIQKGLNMVNPTGGTEQIGDQIEALKSRVSVGIAVSSTKILLTPTR